MKILHTADWHVRGENPRCRADENWLESQRKDIRWIVDLARKEKVDWLTIGGDIFHQSRAATEAVNMVLAELDRFHRVMILPGNHDLPYHSYENLEKSSIGTLLKKHFELKTNHPENHDPHIWDAEPFGLDVPGKAPLRFVHRLVFPDAESRPIEDCGITADELAVEFKANDIILCGDYHQAFVRHLTSGQTVINPGCINIQAADMKDYKPCVMIIEFDPVAKRPIQPKIDIKFLPQTGVVVDDTYLSLEKERDDRMETFLSSVSGATAVTLSFRDNLEAAARTAPQGVQSIVTEILQEVSNEAK